MFMALKGPKNSGKLGHLGCQTNGETSDRLSQKHKDPSQKKVEWPRVINLTNSVRASNTRSESVTRLGTSQKLEGTKVRNYSVPDETSVKDHQSHLGTYPLISNVVGCRSFAK